MKEHLIPRLLSLAFCLLLAAAGTPPVAVAQTAPARVEPAHLEIIVVAGEGLTTNVRQRVAKDPVVRIEDDDHRPVDGAVVTFALPVSGTSGEFANGAKNLTMTTARDGLATARGLKTNDIPGPLQILVMASYQGLRARGIINQTVDVAPGTTVAAPQMHTAKSGGKWKWVLLGVAAAGGAGAAVYFSRHSSSTPASTTLSITAGPVVFGTP